MTETTQFAIGAEASCTDGAQEVQDLPPVDVNHADR
jgi:hypothetical protein